MKGSDEKNAKITIKIEKSISNLEIIINNHKPRIDTIMRLLDCKLVNVNDITRQMLLKKKSLKQ